MAPPKFKCERCGKEVWIYGELNRAHISRDGYASSFYPSGGKIFRLCDNCRDLAEQFVSTRRDRFTGGLLDHPCQLLESLCSTLQIGKMIKEDIEELKAKIYFLKPGLIYLPIGVLTLIFCVFSFIHMEEKLLENVILLCFGLGSTMLGIWYFIRLRKAKYQLMKMPDYDR